MREQGYGRIVFFSSVAGRSGHKHHGPYAATKGAINQLMRVIANEYASRRRDGERRRAGVHGHRADARLPRRAPGQAKRPDRADSGRWRFGELEEVVGPVLFLCSPHASFITGQVLYIDGGRTIV
jgi:gluconate 5-dehydrogenase